MSAKGELRARLAAATRTAHERLHHHSGLAAAARGALPSLGYRDLLARLYGFHKPFDDGFAAAPPAMAAAIDLAARRRSQALGRDLEAFGLGARIADLPLCGQTPALPSEAAWLGALYVVEGSTLGGAQIARALETAGVPAVQRHFFTAYGEQRSQMWRAFVTRLETHAADANAVDEAETSALATFGAFEAWMEGWRGAGEI